MKLFTCRFYKSTESTFTVNVAPSETVSALKEAITNKPGLGHIGQETFNLYKFSRHPGGPKEAFYQWKIEDNDLIDPMSSISTLDPLTSVIVVPLMTLNCWVSSKMSFTIKMSPSAVVSELESAIKHLKACLRDVDLCLYKAPDVGVTEVELHQKVLKPSEGQALVGFVPLSHYFDYPDTMRVHIVVDIAPRRLGMSHIQVPV